MNNILIKVFLQINNLFPKKNHPFNLSKSGVLNLNYTNFEYKHTKKLLDMYSQIIDLKALKNKKILDLWCWWGWKSIYIAEKYDSEVIWIDLNLTFLEEANKTVKEKKLNGKVIFQKESALNTSFKNEQFDVIIMSDVIEHIPNTELLFKEVYRILKKWWIVIFDFAPYFHYYGHHIWDTIQIPWLHLFTTESFRIKLYKQSVVNITDWKKRISLRIWLDSKKQESFVYLNKITRKKFEKIIQKELKKYSEESINYYMLKNIKILWKIPLLREILIKHVVWFLKK